MENDRRKHIRTILNRWLTSDSKPLTEYDVIVLLDIIGTLIQIMSPEEETSKKRRLWNDSVEYMNDEKDNVELMVCVYLHRHIVRGGRTHRQDIYCNFLVICILAIKFLIDESDKGFTDIAYHFSIHNVKSLRDYEREFLKDINYKMYIDDVQEEFNNILIDIYSPITLTEIAPLFPELEYNKTRHDDDDLMYNKILVT